MIGAPAWLFGPAAHPTFVPPLPHVQTGAPGLGLTRARWTAGPSGLGPSQLGRAGVDYLGRYGVDYLGRAGEEEPTIPGLGITRARWAPDLNPHLSTNQQLMGVTDFFDSPMWKYRKPLILGGVALAGLGLLALFGAILK